MKKISVFLFCTVAFISTIMAHGIDSPFDELRVNGKIRLVLEPGDENAVEIAKDESKVSVEVRAGVLVVKRKEMWKYSSYKEYIEVVVVYKDKLRKISADAGADVKSSQKIISGDALRLSFGSGATGQLALDLEDLEVSCGEGAELELNGFAEELTARGSTGGILEAYDLETKRAYARANTGGELEINVSELLEANANTGGRVDYRGNPAKTNTSHELGGKVSNGEEG